MITSALPPLAALRAFEVAVRHKSLSKAASELNVTHAAIAQHVRKLEDWFGTKLLERSGKGVAPTEAGLRLAEGLSDGFSRIHEAISHLEDQQSTRPLRITATPSFTTNWLFPRLSRFQNSNLDVELMINPSAEIVDMTSDAYDIAFRFGGGDWPGLESFPVVASEIYLVAAPCLVERHQIREPADLLNVTWIQELGSDELRFWLQNQEVDARKHKQVLNVPGNLAIEAIRSGQGVGKTAGIFVAEDVAAGRLVRLFPTANDDDLGYHLVYRPGVQRPPLKRFIAWAKSEAAAAT